MIITINTGKAFERIQHPFPFSRGSSQPRDQTQVSCIAGQFFTSWASRETPWRKKRLPTPVFWPGEFHGLWKAPQAFFQSLSSHLAYPGFNKQCGQCEQRDTWPPSGYLAHPGNDSPWGRKESDMTEWLALSHAVGGSSSPMRAKTAAWVPGATWCWVLLCISDVGVCCCSSCCWGMWVQVAALCTGGCCQGQNLQNLWGGI